MHNGVKVLCLLWTTQIVEFRNFKHGCKLWVIQHLMIISWKKLVNDDLRMRLIVDLTTVEQLIWLRVSKSFWMERNKRSWRWSLLFFSESEASSFLSRVSLNCSRLVTFIVASSALYRMTQLFKFESLQNSFLNFSLFFNCSNFNLDDLAFTNY